MYSPGSLKKKYISTFFILNQEKQFIKRKRISQLPERTDFLIKDKTSYTSRKKFLILTLKKNKFSKRKKVLVITKKKAIIHTKNFLYLS